MCGITGYWTPGMAQEQAATVLTAMQEALRHRGPDDAGIWYDAPSGVGFGQRRLAIIDLSPLGHQPMASASGRFTLNFNGEIYNFQPIMDELRALGHAFRGHSDTEVMLAAFEQWGIEAATKRFIGMFAFSLWDAERQLLHLVRDRLGIKPLYYGWQQGSLIFGSELKAFKQHPDFVGEIDRDALGLYFRYNYVPAPYSIYKGIRKQQPGTILTFAGARDLLETTEFWSARQVAEAGLRHPFQGSDDEAVEELDAALRDAIGLRMIADVPLGAFLSGGVDSSTVVALMQAQSLQPVRTFSIGFAEDAYNEAPYAKAVAQHLGTEHTELIVSAQDSMAVIPRLPTIFDEPFSDSSQIPTFLVSEMTRRHVTVSLSGDGGDELFGGYGRYAETLALWGQARYLPAWGKRAASRSINMLPDALLDQAFAWTRPLYTKYGRDGRPSDKLRKAVDLLNIDSPVALYQRSLTHWKDPFALVLGASDQLTGHTDASAWARVPDMWHFMMYMDQTNYLPDDILTKVDRASMAVALEARVPMIDHRVVELAWRLPLDLKVRNGEGKWILKQVLKRYVPSTLFERKKMGFGVPIGEWLKGPLREWAQSLLAPERLRTEGYLRPDMVTAKWQEHLAGTSSWAYYLWDVLMFEAWLEAEKSPTNKSVVTLTSA